VGRREYSRPGVGGGAGAVDAVVWVDSEPVVLVDGTHEVVVLVGSEVVTESVGPVVEDAGSSGTVVVTMAVSSPPQPQRTRERPTTSRNALERLIRPSYRLGAGEAPGKANHWLGERRGLEV
jgi:hypothetical protein